MWYKAAASFVLFVLASIGAPGCVHKTDFDYPEPKTPMFTMHGDTSFTKEERGLIEEAAGIWSKQTDGLATIRFVWDYVPGDLQSEGQHASDNIVVKHTSKEPDIMQEDCDISESQGYPPGFCFPMLLAWVSPSGGIHNGEDRTELNFIPDRYEGHDRWISVAIHEMGHVFGLPHSNFRQAVMWPSNNVAKTCLKQPDLQAFCQANVCEGHTMKPCE